VGEFASDPEVLIAEDGMHLTFQSFRLGREHSPESTPKSAALIFNALRKIVMPTRSLSDNEAIEAQSISSRALPESMFEALLASAKRNPHAKALTFF